MAKPPIICLMGPTATGKTEIALRLHEVFPVDIISVDSALVYRGMDIGTAKPDAATLAAVPHRLIDIRDPEDPYSAGAFVADAVAAINSIHAAGRIPLLAGGTMMYFRALTRGIAELPTADADLREALESEAARLGWPAMHEQLGEVDPAAAQRIDSNDGQRIQRALEVYRLSGRPLTDWQADTVPAVDNPVLRIALLPAERAIIHARIATRLDTMLEQGFLDEVAVLKARPGLHRNSSSMRSVGYRQLWACLDGDDDLATARDKALFATRQLAKRQITWLRSEPHLICFDPLEEGTFEAISAVIGKNLPT